MTLRGDVTYDHIFHESSFGFRNTCADNPGEWEYGHPTAHLAGVIGGWRLRCHGGVLKGWGLWLRNGKNFNSPPPIWATNPDFQAARPRTPVEPGHCHFGEKSTTPEAGFFGGAGARCLEFRICCSDQGGANSNFLHFTRILLKPCPHPHSPELSYVGLSRRRRILCPLFPFTSIGTVGPTVPSSSRSCTGSPSVHGLATAAPRGCEPT